MCADAGIIAQTSIEKKKLGAEAGVDLFYSTPYLHKTVQAK